MPKIPPKANRKRKNCVSPSLYRRSNSIERSFYRLRAFRRVATRPRMTLGQIDGSLSYNCLHRSHYQLLVISLSPR